MGQKNRLIISIILGLGILVGLGLLGMIVYLRASTGRDAAARQVPPPTMFVTLTKPFNGSRLAMGEPIPVAAEAVGFNPVQSLELWADGELVNRTNSQMPELKQLNGFWNWTPTSEGSHTLMTRGFDVQGQIVLSNIVQVNVGPPPPVIVQMMPKAGDTLDSLAAEYNIPPLEAADANPEIDPAAPLEVNQPVMIPFSTGISLPPGWSPPSTSGVPAGEPPSIPPPPPPPGPPGDEPYPSAPELKAKADGCKIIATITSTSDVPGYYNLYIIGPGTNGKAQGVSTVISRPSGQQVEVTIKATKDENGVSSGGLFGKYQLFVEAVNDNGTGATDSAPVNVSVLDGACAKFAPPISEVKVITTEKIGRLYCFVTIDQKTYIRVPLTPDSFISPMSAVEKEEFKNRALKNSNLTAGTGFDLTPYLPLLHPKDSGSSEVIFNCWDWDKAASLGVAQKFITNDELGKFAILSTPNYSVLGIFGSSNPGYQSFVTLLPPKNLRTTGDPKICAQHTDYKNNIAPFYDVCAGIISTGTVAFVWDGDYTKTGLCFPGTEKWCTQVNDIDGFRLYRYIDQTGNQEVAFTTYDQDRQTLAFTPWPTDSAICFTARAYKGSIESADSNVVCLTKDQMNTTGAKTIDIKPSRMGVNCSTYDYSGQGCWFHPVGVVETGPLTIGNYWRYDEDEGEVGRYNVASAIIRFDKLGGMIVSEVEGKPILSARLKFRMTYTVHQHEPAGYDDVEVWVSGSESCAYALGAVKQSFVTLGTYPNSLPKYDLIQHPAHPFTWDEISVDVTDTVKGWAQGQNNYGFILDGGSAGTVQLLDRCETTYDNFSLEITYFPNK